MTGPAAAGRSARAPLEPPRHASSGGPAVGALAVGVLGELLITAGVLLGLFVAWQLWWTDVVGEQAQAQLVVDLGWQPPSGEPADEVLLRRGPAPVLDQPEPLTTFATLQVPRWDDVARPISQGTDKREVLDTLGMGHYDGTAMPGGIGNFAVAGHRTTYGRPLHRVEELVVGDPLVVRTADTWYVYRVTSTRVVAPQQVEVIAPVPGSPDAAAVEAMMTLTTCHPMFSARERFIVHAVLDEWLPVVDGTPPALVGGA